MVRALDKAIEDNTTPPSWIMQLELGNKGDSEDVRVTKVTPRSLSADFAS